ncbi:MAG: anti-sigma factor [Flavobacteriales bacterium]
MIKKAFFIIFVISALFSCDKNTILESTGTAQFSVNGLPTLPSNYTYETWLLVSGSYVSTGTFNVDTIGASTVTEFKNINNYDLSNATGVAITVEFTGTGSKSSPSDMIILAGDFSGNTTNLVTTDTRTIYASDLKADYIVDAPTALASEKSITGQNGIWFTTDLNQTTNTPGLTLPYNQNNPNKAVSNLLYQGWLYAEDATTGNPVPLNMGTFAEANSVDNSNSYAGTYSGFTPILPGNDFINITGENVTTPIEVVGKRVIITAKPNEETTADSTPFAFILFDKIIDVTDGTLAVFSNYSASFTRN